MALQSFDNFTSNISDVASSTGPTSYLSNLVITICIVIFFIFSSIGNLVTIATIKSNSHLQNITNTFIASLCVTDLISTSISPLWLHRTTWGYSDWQWSKFLCNFFWVSEFSTNYVTILHIASFSALRFAAVYKSFGVWDITKTKVVYFITLLWIFSVTIASPLGILVNVIDKSKQKNENELSLSLSCTIIREENCCLRQFKTYSFILGPAMVFLPLIFIVVCSCMLVGRVIKQNRKLSNTCKYEIHELKKKQINSTESCNYSEATRSCITTNEGIVKKINRSLSPNQVNFKSKNEKSFKQQKKLTFQLSLVVFSFVLGYTPSVIYVIWSTIAPKTNSKKLDYWLGIVSYLCLHFSQCLNPVMYNLGSNKLRLATRKLLQKITERFIFKSGSSNCRNSAT